MRVFVLLALLTVSAVPAVSQQLSNQAKAQQVAAAFTKNKHEVKEKYGVRVEKYKDVRSEPLVRQNISDYAGLYEVRELGFAINIQVGSDGRLQVTGSEQGARLRKFRLENARIEGAVITGSKVYEDGATEKFEGAFLKRIDRNSPNDPGKIMFGLGVILDTPLQHDTLNYEKLFYQLQK